MKLWVLAGLLVTCLVFWEAGSSMVKVTNNGYEDIVIAINQNIQEDTNIITKIQDMVKEATTYLFYATKKRLYIRSVKILIPSSWANRNYNKSKTETYDKADVIIANSYLKYRDDPYTLQYGRCGEPGRYIHLTPNFLLDDSLLSVYGPRGRVFVHEWAHLRWGVFDEYNVDTPYYIARNGKVEATRCSKYILGVNVKRQDQCKGNSCNIKHCVFNQNTGLYEDGCVFIPEKSQSIKQSIMYSQAIPSVSEFCDSSNHNIEAPTLQNKMCNFLSTWDVIKNSSDISSTPPMTGTMIPVPSFSLIQKREKVITLVLDVSGSMSTGNRLKRLYQAAEVFLTQIVETGSSVGIVTFSSDAYEISQLVKINSDVQRNHLKALLPTTTIGGTNICIGILTGFAVNKRFDGSTDGTEIVLLTDGEDNYDTRLCFPNITESGSIIHFIALGPSASQALEDIAEMTGGLNYKATDKVDSNGLIDAFSGIQPLTGDDISFQLESTGSTVLPGTCVNGTVIIDSTVGNDTFFLVTWQSAVPNIKLQDPKGKVYTQANFTSDFTTKSSRLAVPGTAERGTWRYNICNTLTISEGISVIVNSKAADKSVPPITVQARMNTIRNSYPNPMIVYASVTQGLLPVTGVNVTAIIEPDVGDITYLDPLDNGAGADVVKNDGIYSKYFFSYTVNGRYSLKVRVKGKDGSRLAPPTSHAYYVPGFVENGTVVLNAPNPGENDTVLHVNLGDFSRTSSGGSFVISNVPLGPRPDIFAPEKISDLQARMEGDRIVLSWTATGDDLDQGSASGYDLRMSTDLKELLERFDNSSTVNISVLTPRPAGSSETFTFVPKNVVLQNGTILFFAMTAVDKASQRSSVSNIAQAALIIPKVDTTTIAPPAAATTNSANIRTIPLLIVLVCFYLSIHL